MRSWPALDISFHQSASSGGSTWDLVQAALTDFDVAAIDDNADERWRVFFHTNGARDAAAAALQNQCPTLSTDAVDVADEDWAARSQASLKAVRVGRIIVAPPWDVGDPAGDGDADAITVVIRPSMGFGTAHHATTRLCLLHLQELEPASLTALDIGTGSGVLAIAASRLGAGRVLAIDDDADAIQSARENVELNPGAQVTLGLVDVRQARLRPFDLILANLTGTLLTSAAGAIEALSARGGRLILGGFMETEAAGVLAAFGSSTPEKESREDGWVCVTLRRLT